MQVIFGCKEKNDSDMFYHFQTNPSAWYIEVEFGVKCCNIHQKQGKIEVKRYNYYKKSANLSTIAATIKRSQLIWAQLLQLLKEVG